LWRWDPVHVTTPEAAEQLIERMANAVHRYGLEVPAVFLLEASKPLSFAASSLVHMLTPILGIYTDSDHIFYEFAEVLSDRSLLEKFICRIEELAKEADAR
jgi:hypothetical protein